MALVPAVGLLLLCLLHVNVWSARSTEIPCTYVGHLVADTNWYGFLANITILATGRMTFEFSYPADKCCQNVLFYTDEELSEFSTRMNCWQKEYLFSPENDQILRLTPRFSWSGCHLTYPDGMPYYDCVGGRSFTSHKASNRPTTWYLAVSNCASISGLDLHYMFRVYGQLGECSPPGYRILTTTPPPTTPTPKVGEVKEGTPSGQVADKNCIIEGNLNTSVHWYGFLANLTLNGGGGFKFFIEHPFRYQQQNLILYDQDEIVHLNSGQKCFEKERIVREGDELDRIMELSFRASWNGCATRNFSMGSNITCQGQKHFNEPRQLYIAVSNCWSQKGLALHYRLEVEGYEPGTCSGASRGRYLSTHGQHSWIIFVTSHITTWISIAVILCMQMGYQHSSPYLALSSVVTQPTTCASHSAGSSSACNSVCVNTDQLSSCSTTHCQRNKPR